MIYLNVGCGPHRAPEPWINLDVHEGDGNYPDIVVEDASRPCAGWESDTVDRIYLGHVLEHIPVDELPGFLADIHRVLKPDGEIAVVGPDVFRTIKLWKEGTEPWTMIDSVLEGPDFYAESPATSSGGWRYARHWWNCHEERVVLILKEAGFVDVTPLSLDQRALRSWPVVGFAKWQCAVVASK